MKRMLPVIIIGAVVLLLAGIGFGVALYYALPHFGGLGKRPPADDPPPFTYEEMEKLHDNPEQAAKEIPKIIACFENGSEQLREMAALTLGEIGPKAVEPLREKLTDENGGVRFYCAQALAHLKNHAAPAVPDLLKCLQDTDPRVRYKAAYALGQTGVKSDAIFVGVLGTLDDKDDDVRETSLKVLEDMGAPPKESLPKLAKLASKDSPPDIRTMALKLLGQMGKDAVPAFKDLLKQADTLDTIAMIGAISALGADAKPLVPDLQTIMIKSRFWDAQEEMLLIFKKCEKEGAAGLANVLKTLCDPKMPDTFAPDDGRCLVLLKAIGEIGPDAKDTVSILTDVLKEREKLQLVTLDTLGSIGPAAAKDAIPAVEALLKDTDMRRKVAANEDERKTLKGLADACRASMRRMGKFDKVSSDPPPFSYKELEELGQKTENAAKEIPRIIACFENGDEDLRLLAAETLKNIGAKAVDPLRAQLTDKNANVRFCCVQSLALIGKDAAAAIDDVLARTQDESPMVRYKAVYALGKLGVQSDAVFAALVKALEDKDDRVTETAIEVLDTIGTPPKAALPTLAKLATKAADPVRRSATKLLGKMGEPAVPTFRELLKNPNANERQLVIQAMVPLGPDAKALAPDLLLIVREQTQTGFIDPNLFAILKKCGPDGAKGLANMLKSVNNESVAYIGRAAILKAIGEMRSEAETKATVPILIELLKANTPTHPIVEYRPLILEALGDIGLAANAAIPTVEGLLKEPAMAAPAQVALRRMGKVEKK